MKPLNRIRSNRKISTTLAALVLTGALSGVSMAAIDVYQFDNPRQEAQYRALIEEFPNLS